MSQPVPTVDEILTLTHIGSNWHEWGADGGVIRVPAAELRLALEDAYDPCMPDWPSTVELGE